MVQSTSAFANSLRNAKEAKSANLPKKAENIQKTFEASIRKEDKTVITEDLTKTTLSKTGKTKMYIIIGGIIMAVIILFKKYV